MVDENLRAILNVTLREGDARDPFQLTGFARNVVENKEFEITSKIPLLV